MEEALKSQEKKPVSGLCRWNDELKTLLKREQNKINIDLQKMNHWYFISMVA
jgi:hypothetical protein